MLRHKGQAALAAAAMMMCAFAPASAREVVPYEGSVQAGTIVIKTAERRLYLVVGNGTAIRYPVAVGRPGKQWQGSAQVSGKYVQPAWSPPDEVSPGRGQGRQPEAAERDPRWVVTQSDGSARDDAIGRSVCHSRH